MPDYKHILLSILLFTACIIHGQSDKKMDYESYKAELNNLTILKTKLVAEREISKAEIDSLTKHLDILKETLKLELQSLYVLKYGKENGMRVSNKQIWKGMTERMLSDSWGNPDRINKNAEKWGVFTQWYYGDVVFFFRDGKLTDWEEKK